MDYETIARRIARGSGHESVMEFDDTLSAVMGNFDGYASDAVDFTDEQRRKDGAPSEELESALRHLRDMADMAFSLEDANLEKRITDILKTVGSTLRRAISAEQGFMDEVRKYKDFAKDAGGVIERLGRQLKQLDHGTMS